MIETVTSVLLRKGEVRWRVVKDQDTVLVETEDRNFGVAGFDLDTIAQFGQSIVDAVNMEREACQSQSPNPGP